MNLKKPIAKISGPGILSLEQEDDFFADFKVPIIIIIAIVLFILVASFFYGRKD